MQVRNLEICIHQIKMENKAKLEELEAKAELDEAKIKKNDNERKHYEMLLANERKEFEVQLAREREANRKLITENLSLKDAVGALQQSNSNLEDTISLKDRSIAKNESLIEAKSKVLQQKDIVISDIGEHLSRVREFLTSKQQQVSLLSCLSTDTSTVTVL